MGNRYFSVVYSFGVPKKEERNKEFNSRELKE
jgi:hypothetical protein